MKNARSGNAPGRGAPLIEAGKPDDWNMTSDGSRPDPCHLQRLAGESAGAADGDLLTRFAAERDDAAFELLVWRHHRLVLGVCRKVLRDPHAADDAFQATFLILARKAGTIARRAAVAGWLYRVAYRCARRARRNAARDAARAVSGQDLSALPAALPTEPTAEREDNDRLLTEELARLPERYRLPVVLCYLEGRTYDDAAARIGCPKGTLSTRLTKARQLLRARLAARGVTVSAPAIIALLAEAASPAAPTALLTNTLKLATAASGPGAIVPVSPNAAVLAEGVLRAMFWNRVKVLVIAFAALAALGTGVGIAMYPPAAAQGPTPPAPAKADAAPAKGQENDPDEEVWWLKSIDKEGGTIEVESCNPVTLRPYAPGAAPPVEVRVGAGAEILIDGKPGQFGDLIPGIPVRFKFDSFSGTGIGKIRQGSGTILKLRTVQERTVDAVVDQVGANGATLSVTEETGRKDYKLAEGARVTIDGKDAKVTELKPGMTVSLRLSAVYPVIFGVTAIGPQLDGVVRIVDAERKSLSVLLRSPRLVVSGLSTEGAAITVGGKPGTLTDLRPGMRVQLQWAADPEARRILTVRELGSESK
jgi:RNA polymerase sigma factor (sigma-70 family)